MGRRGMRPLLPPIPFGAPLLPDFIFFQDLQISWTLGYKSFAFDLQSPQAVTHFQVPRLRSEILKSLSWQTNASSCFFKLQLTRFEITVGKAFIII